MNPRINRGTLRKREIVFAVSMGVPAAAGGALVLDGLHDRDAPVAIVKHSPTYDLAPFTSISTSGPQNVAVTQGGVQSVSAGGAPEALGQLDVTVADGTLTIRPKRQHRGFNWRRLASITFHITVPRLEAASLAGSGNLRVDRVAGSSFAGSLLGPGDLTIGSLQVEKVDLSLAGSGNLAAGGRASEARLSIAGSGNIAAAGLHSRKAAISIGGSGDAALTVDDDARIAILGSGDVAISGPAHCSVSRMGSGEASCANSSGN